MHLLQLINLKFVCIHVGGLILHAKSRNFVNDKQKLVNFRFLLENYGAFKTKLVVIPSVYATKLKLFGNMLHP